MADETRADSWWNTRVGRVVLSPLVIVVVVWTVVVVDLGDHSRDAKVAQNETATSTDLDSAQVESQKRPSLRGEPATRNEDWLPNQSQEIEADRQFTERIRKQEYDEAMERATGKKARKAELQKRVAGWQKHIESLVQATVRERYGETVALDEVNVLCVSPRIQSKWDMGGRGLLLWDDSLGEYAMSATFAISAHTGEGEDSSKIRGRWRVVDNVLYEEVPLRMTRADGQTVQPVGKRPGDYPMPLPRQPQEIHPNSMNEGE